MSDSLTYGREFRLVDEILSIDASAGLIATSKVYRSDWDIVAAHALATGPVVPGVLLIEQAAQSALMFQLHCNLDTVGQPRLVNIRATWSLPAPLDIPVHAHVRVRDATANTSSFEASIVCNGSDIARIRGLVAYVWADEPTR